MTRDIDELGRLAHKLTESIRLRKLLNLGDDELVGIQKVKPSGATMRQKHKHIVRIYYGGELVKTMPLPEYEELVK